MATTFRWLPYNAPDVAVAGATLNALATAGYAYGAEIDNSVLLYTLADLTVALSAAVVSVAPASLTVFVLPNIDGNYTTAAGNPGSSYSAGTYSGAGGSVQFMQVRGIILPPNKFKIVLLNALGVALPATTTSVCSLYRYGEQSF